MLDKLLAIAPRDHDPLTVRRGRALALLLIVLASVTLALIPFALMSASHPDILINPTIALTLFVAAYMINRSGRVQLAATLLQIVMAVMPVIAGLNNSSPIPAVFLLSLTVVVAAAFGRPRDALIWGALLSGVPFVINLLLYGALAPDLEAIRLPGVAFGGTLIDLETSAVGMIWVVALAAYFISRLLNQVIAEERAAAAESRAANRSLRQSEERFAKIFQASPIAICIVLFPEGRIIDVNESYLKLTRHSSPEVLGRTLTEAGLWASTQERDRVIQMLGTGESVREIEIDFRAGTGEVRTALASFEQIELDGRTCILAMFYDISERKRIEAALRESEEQYRLITENASDLITIFDMEGRFVYASPSHRQFLGLDPASLIGRRGIEFMHPDDLETIREQTQKLRAAGTAQTTFRYRHSDGSWRWLEAFATGTLRQGVPYTVIVARDVTERRRLEAQIQQAQKMESVGRLAGGVAHDFNNLLTAITGYAEMARDTLPPGGPAREDIGELLKAAERATGLTRQLLAFARKQKIEPRVIDLNTLILDMEKLLRRLIGEDVELVTRASGGPALIKADPGQIEQVIVNLAVNARDAMPDGGRLTIETGSVAVGAAVREASDLDPGDYVVLAVGDTGMGIDAAHQEHLFEPFFTTKPVGKGTGLGLATCYGIVKQHGGHIEVISAAGSGTIFQIYLPRAEGQPDATPAPGERAETPRGGETVLLVEDEDSVRILAARVLRAQGYTVIEAGHGAAALDLVRSSDQPIDLLLSDMVMPQMGGPALVEQITALRPGVRVLFMSGYSDRAVEGYSLPDAALPFLHKPFSPADLARKVREVLDGDSAGVGSDAG